MKLLRIAIIAFVCSLTIVASAQTAAVKPLKIGDRIPEMTFSPVINYKSTSVKLSDFKDRLLILDFWATWCHFCVEAFPKEDSLAAQFGNKIQFMLVDAKAWDTEAKVKGFYAKKLSSPEGFKLPSIYLDTVLNKRFPTDLIPSYVWIRKGVIVAITSAEEINAPNISAVLSGRELHLVEKLY